MKLRAIFRSVSPFLGAGATVLMLVALVAAIYFTWLDLHWVAFLAGILAAAVLSIVSRASHAEWVIARRGAQLVQVRATLQSESVLRKHAEDALAAVRANIRYLDEALPAMIAYVDAGFTVRYHNRALRDWLGAAREAIDERPAGEALGSLAWADLEGPCREALAGRVAQAVRGQELASGARFRFAVQCLPHHGSDGRVLGAFIVQTDVTDPLQDRHSRAAAPDPAAEHERSRVIYADTLAEELTDWDNVADRLRAALAGDEFCLYSQAISPLSFIAARTPFHELLVRLREEEENLMPPGTFLPLAEQHGLMPALDRWVVRHLLAWAAGNAGRQESTYSINVAVPTVLDEAFPAYVKAELGRHGLSGRLLCFEIAEAGATQHLRGTATFVEGVRACGCQTTLCGFGRSLASFDILRPLAVDFLKIDAGIVLRVASSAVDAAKVKAIVRVAHDTRRKTIAECVEDPQTLELLKKLGVDYAQGFGISRPAPLEELG